MAQPLHMRLGMKKKLSIILISASIAIAVFTLFRSEKPIQTVSQALATHEESVSKPDLKQKTNFTEAVAHLFNPSTQSTRDSLREKFKTVVAIELKPFPSLQEKEQRHALLADTKLIQASFELLKSEDGYFERDEKGFKADRLNAIEYLAQAVGWPQNPQRSQILSSIKETLSVSKPPETTDLMKKKSWIGDQMELYSILLQSNPTEARQFENEMQGTRLATILKMSRNRTQALTQKENL